MTTIRTRSGKRPQWEKGDMSCRATTDSPSPAMVCWLAEGHRGDHWDKVDALWWSLSDTRDGPLTAEERERAKASA